MTPKQVGPTCDAARSETRLSGGADVVGLAEAPGSSVLPAGSDRSTRLLCSKHVETRQIYEVPPPTISRCSCRNAYLRQVERRRFPDLRRVGRTGAFRLPVHCDDLEKITVIWRHGVHAKSTRSVDGLRARPGYARRRSVRYGR